MISFPNHTNTLSITNKTGKNIPRSLLERVFRIVFKKHTMEISVVFVGERAMKALHKKWRGKNVNTNVLAFPLDGALGEIFINPHQAEREAKTAGIPYSMRVAYLFAHGLLHLRGYDHETERDAKRMERKEQKIMQNVNIKM